MAIKKVYRSKTGSDYHVTLMVDGARVLVSLEGKEPSYTTTNEKIQKALEANRYFKQGFIVIESQEESIAEVKESSIVVDALPVGEPIEGGEKPMLKNKVEKDEEKTIPEKTEEKIAETPKVEESTTEGKVHAGITRPLDARDILIETYGVSPQGVQKNPEAILKKAAELGVSFPDVKVDAQ